MFSVVPGEVTTTRGLMISSIFLVAVALMVAAVGMKCTTCLADNKQQKSKVALAGGVLFILADMLLFISIITNTLLSSYKQKSLNTEERK